MRVRGVSIGKEAGCREKGGGVTHKGRGDGCAEQDDVAECREGQEKERGRWAVGEWDDAMVLNLQST